MAKIAAILVSLILLGSWGWFAWQEYEAATVRTFANHDEGRKTMSLVGFAKFALGVEPRAPEVVVKPLVADPQTSVQIALGATVALCATLVFAVTGGTGAIFSIALAAFVSFFTAAAHLLFASVLLARVGVFLFGEQRYELHLNEYGVALYCLVSLVTAIVMIVRLRGLVRGERSQTHAVLKCLTVLLIVGLGLAPVGVPPEFVLFEVHGLYTLAALCLASLALIGLTYSNYRYD
jgi:hypothetical protein